MPQTRRKASLLILCLATAACMAARDLPSPRDGARQSLLDDVDRAWRQERAAAPAGARDEEPAEPNTAPLAAKLDRIVVPAIAFADLPLSGVVESLASIAQELDAADADVPGVNFVLLDADGTDPGVTLSLRNVSLRRIVAFVAESVGYDFVLENDAVVIRPRDQPALETRFYAISRATALRLAGRTAPAARTANLAPPAPMDGASATEFEAGAIRAFLQSAGVAFDAIAGATMAFDGSQLIVSHTPRNLDLIESILARYRQLRQVEIEAKFMEVQEGALEELGIQWRAATSAAQQNARIQGVYSSGNGTMRSLNEAFSFQGQNRTLEITVPGNASVGTDPDGTEEPVITPGVNVSLPVAPPSIPGGVSLGAPGAILGQLTGMLGEFDVNAIVRALQQRSGTELLSAPRLTVLSGNSATITVAQELRYPQSYGQIQSQVGTGSVNGGGSAGVSITSGTPQEFATRNVGVELRVTATVEEDDQSISLDLNPKVTEFEGFVEYGGPSVAISGGTTVTVPPGFYQPIFAVREVTTRVTLWDGATLIMGGLTREDVKKVHDRVPVLGSLPLIGRLFRSEGESTQKRNLLIFVTARLVGPSGAPINRGGHGLPPATTAYENEMTDLR